MTTTNQLNNKWLKASVLGCLWASSEIVLGSFLHNMRIPFSSNLLTSIGIILIISVSHLWNEKGLIWRSGLVCALMKSISPSAIIFGPMIAIFFEALLLELAVRLFGKNILGYLLGGLLATSWNLFQRIINFIIIYGFNIVDLYNNLAKFALKQLNIQTDNLWQPIIALWIVYLAFGLVAAIIGIYMGRKALKSPYKTESISVKKINEIKKEEKPSSFQYSLVWLIFNILGIILVLSLMNFKGWIWWCITGCFLIICWIFRYQRALMQLKKPKFWVFFVLITMLSSLLFAKFQNDRNEIYEGLIIGMQMNFRAAMMIIGFSTIGTELYNPAIRSYLRKTWFRQLPLALEVAFDTLPYVIANLPGFKNIFRQPVSILLQMVSQAGFWLDKLTIRFKEKQPIIIISGNKEEGKSTLLNRIVNYLDENNIKVGGFVSPCFIEDNIHIGYDIINLATREKTELSRIHANPELIRVGKYYFLETGLEFGKNALLPDNNAQSQIILVDEVGPWELENQGWAPYINELFLKTNIPMIWVVRSSIVEKVIENWNLNNPKIFNVKEDDLSSVEQYISSNMVFIKNQLNGQLVDESQIAPLKFENPQNF